MMANELDHIILDPLLRLNRLYSIIDKGGQKQIFRLNWAQRQLYDSMHFCNIILKARQLGISTFICLLFLDRCLFNSNLAAGIICHTREDAEHMFKRVKFAYDALPQAIRSLRTATVDSARELVFSNGSSLRVGTSMRGSTLNYLHVSEFGKICSHYPEKAREIITGSLNTLSPGQYCFIESTAEGRDGHFFEMSRKAQAMRDAKEPLSKLDFRFHFFPWWRCPDYALDRLIPVPPELAKYFESLAEIGIALTPQQKSWYAAKQSVQQDDMRREFPSTPAESFETSAQGAYYAQQLATARHQGRISNVPYDEDVPVHTAWDLGYGDSTSIWWFQIVGKEIHILEYHEESQKALTYYLKLVKSKDYSYGKHLAPFDISVHEYSSGHSRQELAARHGVNFIRVPDVGIDEGIDAARLLFPRLWFDERRCELGLKSLDSYRRQWNEKQGCWGAKPLHNFASHGADAFRMLAVGLNLIVGDGEMNEAKAAALERKAMYGKEGFNIDLEESHPLYAGYARLNY